MPQATERAGLLRRSEEVESHAVRVALVEVITGVPGARLALEFLNKNTDFKTSIESRPGVEFEKDCIPPRGLSMDTAAMAAIVTADAVAAAQFAGGLAATGARSGPDFACRRAGVVGGRKRAVR